MTSDRKGLGWPPTRRDLVGLGSLLLFAAGLVVIGYGLAITDLAFTVIGFLALILPIVRWFRVQRDPDGTWTFGGEMEKPPDSASEPPADEWTRHSG